MTTHSKVDIGRACSAIVALLQTRLLILEGMKLAKQARRYEKRHDAIKSLAKSLHAEACLISAGAVMTATFGRQGDLREHADKALIGLVKNDMPKSKL